MKFTLRRYFINYKYKHISFFRQIFTPFSAFCELRLFVF